MNSALCCLFESWESMTGAAYIVRGKASARHAGYRRKKLTCLLLLMNREVLFGMDAGARMGPVQISLGAANLSPFAHHVQVLLAALVDAGRGTIVAMLAIVPVEVLLGGALRQGLHRALQRMGDSFSPQMFWNWIVLFDELVDRHEASTYAKDQIVVLKLHDHLLCEVAVISILYAVLISHEQALHSLLRVTLVDIVG